MVSELDVLELSTTAIVPSFDSCCPSHGFHFMIIILLGNSLIGLVARMLSYYPYLVKALKAYVPLHYVHWSRSSRGLSLCMKVFKKCRLDLKKPGRRVCRLQQKHIFTKGESRSQRKEMKLISQMFTATHFPLTRFVVAMVLVSTSLWAHGNYSLT